MSAGEELAPIYAFSDPKRIPGRYIVRFKDQVDDSKAAGEALVSERGGRIYQHLSGLKAFWGELPDAAIQMLRRNPTVAYIEADVAVPAAGVGDTTQSGAPWWLDRVDQSTLPLNGTYQYSATGANVHIWIVDAGVDRNASDLAGRVDENFYFTSFNNDPFVPCTYHGTGVAIKAAGSINGVAKQATIHSARASTNCNNPPSISTGAASAAFHFIADYSPRPAVANYSAGGSCAWWGCGQTVDDAAKYAQSKGVAVIVSAGNEGQNACDFAPAHTTELITVAASNASDQRINIPGGWASNYGPCVDIFAPVQNSGGTSEAAPLVTGVAALYLQLFPTANAQSVASHILGKSTLNVLSNIGSGSPNRLLYSKPPGLSVGINGPATLGESTYCTWYSLVAGGQPPYTYVWRHNGSIAGTAEFYSVGPAGNQNFQIQVTVTDGVGRVSSNYLNVAIDPYNTQFLCE